MANDPSSVVDPRLVPHLHLLCRHNYPLQPQPLHFANIRDYLLQAPQIVKDHATVAWTYLNKPQNGRVMLAYQPPRMQLQYATDGYVWMSAEKTFQQNMDGFRIELFVQESGFDPTRERVTMHRRTRYRLTGNAQNLPFDPCLEIIHYTESLPGHQYPVNTAQIPPLIQRQLQSREWLERQGLPNKTEFMLHDSTRWQRIELPRQPMPTNPYQPNPIYARPMPQAVRGPGPQQPPNPAAGMGLPPTPIGRRGDPTRGINAGNVAMQAPMRIGDLAMEDEDNVMGDHIDFLNPYEISITRFKQHHEWMEEILSSPYHEGQLKPVELGLRLTGELGQLTAGLFDPSGLGTQPSAIAKAPFRDALVESKYGEQADRGFRDPHPNPNELSSFEIAEYEPLDEAKVKELEKRVAEFLKKGEEQVATMKKSHSRHMSELKREKFFASLERRLAEVSPDDTEYETRVGEILREAENVTDSTLTAREKTTCVQKGGIITAAEQAMANIEEGEQQLQEEESAQHNDQQEEGDDDDGSKTNQDVGGEFDHHENGDTNENNLAGDDSTYDNFTNLDTAGEALQFLDHEDDSMDYAT